MAFTPYDAGQHAIGRARALLDLSGDKTLTALIRADLRRLSIVMSVAALDTYLHRLVVARCYEHDELPASLAKLSVTFEQLLSKTDEIGEAARRDPHSPRPRVALKKELRQRLLRETFQRAEDVGRALGMAGKPKAWDKIASAYTPRQSSADLQARLNGIVARRNQIVHEGDYLQLDRPQKAKRNDLSTAQARQSIDFLDRLINAIHAIP